MQAVIGGAVVALVVAGGLRWKKAADEGEIDVDDAKHKIKRKVLPPAHTAPRSCCAYSED